MNEIRQLIEVMQSNLVELFEQLQELRERLHIVTGQSSDSSPSIVPLFSEIRPKSDNNENTHTPNKESSVESLIHTNETNPLPSSHLESDSQSLADVLSSEEPVPGHVDSSTMSAKVSRVLDPIAHELRTGEATADIILEYLQTAKAYLIDEEEGKKKVGRDMDIVLNFLKARGKRGIRSEERDNILKRIRRWKAHLISPSDSPAE